jgi:hypothetical protein
MTNGFNVHAGSDSICFSIHDEDTSNSHRMSVVSSLGSQACQRGQHSSDPSMETIDLFRGLIVPELGLCNLLYERDLIWSDTTSCSFSRV